MRIKFAATPKNPTYTISGTTINGVDLSVIPPDTNISPLPQELSDAGIRAIHTDETGDIFVTLEQATLSSQYPNQKAHWRENSVYIDAADYDPNQCYVIPTGVADIHDYETVWAERTVKKPDGSVAYTEEGWTVRKLEATQ